MRYYFSFSLTLFFFQIIGQTSDCTSGRYTSAQFTNVTKTTVQYGKNININTTDSLDLFMDIYTPDGDDAQSRPAIILAHGGAFISGDRGSLEDLCRQYARQGYVTASISYHLWPLSSGFPDSLELVDVVIKAIGDMKGAIRYFKNDRANDNLWKVDSSRIIIGGSSAGAITAMHASHMDTTDTALPPFIKTAIDTNGGIEGQANKLNNTSSVLATVNLSGALYDRRFIDENDPPFISYHGNNDEIVSFRRAKSFNIITLEGSYFLHQQADEVGILNKLDSVDGGGHSDIYSSPMFATNLADFYNNANIFLGSMVCPQVITSNRTVAETSNISIAPNPATDWITISLDNLATEVDVTMYTIQGQLIGVKKGVTSNPYNLDITALERGLYFIELSNNSGLRIVKKIVIQ